MHPAPPAKNRRRGFTLVELLFALPLAALMLGGAMTLFIESQRLTQRATVQVQGSQDAATGLQYVLSNAREALMFALPPDTAGTNTNGLAFTPPTGTAAGYESGSGASAYNTGVEFAMPATTNYSLLGSGGTQLNLSPGGYNRGTTGDLLWVYRSDAQGNPAPTNGQYLWSRRRPAGAPSDGSQDVSQVICKFLLTRHGDGTSAGDAVQFIGKNTAGTDITSAFEMEVKIVCGDLTSINGTQTNEATDGTSVDKLYGKCALMRNHA